MPLFSLAFRVHCSHWPLIVRAAGIGAVLVKPLIFFWLIMLFQPPSEARWFSFSSTVRRGAEEVPSVRDVAAVKCPYFLEFFNENRRKWSLGIDAGSYTAIFGFCHQGAELFSAQGRKTGVLAVLRVFEYTKGPQRVPKPTRNSLRTPGEAVESLAARWLDSRGHHTPRIARG